MNYQKYSPTALGLQAALEAWEQRLLAKQAEQGALQAEVEGFLPLFRAAETHADVAGLAAAYAASRASLERASGSVAALQGDVAQIRAAFSDRHFLSDLEGERREAAIRQEIAAGSAVRAQIVFRGLGGRTNCMPMLVEGTRLAESRVYPGEWWVDIGGEVSRVPAADVTVFFE
jgi:hypothetical protein